MTQSRADRALTAPRLRTAAWGVVGGLGVLVVVGGAVVHHDRAPLHLEVRVQDAIDSHIGNTQAWNHVFGTVIPRVGLVLLLALMTWTLIQRWWRGLLACAAGPIAVALTEHVLKPAVDRMDPGNPVLFYQSGHLTGVGAITVLVLVLVVPRFGRPGVLWSVVALCVVAAGMALLATIAGHGHGPLDSLAGLPTGIAIALAWVLLLDLVFDDVARRRLEAVRSRATAPVSR
ncbi:MAG: hypothetical protein MUP67_02925 [Acidimicrobiia bacterium]|nr:hypothetical protein [Acidimicrobiia bacterium]